MNTLVDLLKKRSQSKALNPCEKALIRLLNDSIFVFIIIIYSFYRASIFWKTERTRWLSLHKKQRHFGPRQPEPGDQKTQG